MPLALSQGTFDGFVSTNESVATAKLWEAGVRYSYQDHQYVGQYMPMISDAFWAKLTPDLQKIMLDLWAANIGTYRANAGGVAGARRARRWKKPASTFTDPSQEVLDKAAQGDAGGCRRRWRRTPSCRPRSCGWPRNP